MNVLKTMVLTGVLVLTGCQAAIYGTATELDELQVGMTETEVQRTLGEPVSIAVHPDTGDKELIYKKMKHAISDWPRTYKVIIRQDLVVGWGEQYNEQNVNLF